MSAAKNAPRLSIVQYFNKEEYDKPIGPSFLPPHWLDVFLAAGEVVGKAGSESDDEDGGDEEPEDGDEEVAGEVSSKDS